MGKEKEPKKRGQGGRRKGGEKAEEGKGLERVRENTSRREQRGGEERWNREDNE